MPVDQRAATRPLAVLVGLTATVVFLLCFLATRNIYDDEVRSLALVLLPLPELWDLANNWDLHPPGMYALTRVTYLLVGSARWAALGGVLFSAVGIGVFVNALLRAGTLRGPAAAVFLAVACLHPQFLMWGSSMRWQSYWSGLFLVALTLGLSLGREPRDGCLAPPGLPARIALGLIIGSTAYLNYMTLVMLPLFVLAWLLRYGVSGSALRALALPLAIAAVLFLPQLPSFAMVHLPNSSGRASNPGGAVLKLVPGVTVGQAMMPWHPVAPLVGLVSLLALWKLGVRLRTELLAAGSVRLLALRANPAWLVLLFFEVGAFLIAVSTGLGLKPRSFTFLGPVFAFLVATAWNDISGRVWRGVVATVLALWIGFSAGNLLAKRGTQKGGFNDRHDEVLAVAREEASGVPALFFTHDSALAFAINAAARETGQRWRVCSIAPDRYHGLPCGPEVDLGADLQKVFLVDSFISSFQNEKQKLYDLQGRILEAMHVERRAMRSFDHDAAMKRRVPHPLAPYVTDYRFMIFVGSPRSNVDWRRFADAYR
jgi:hypothetical protein